MLGLNKIFKLCLIPALALMLLSCEKESPPSQSQAAPTAEVQVAEAPAVELQTQMPSTPTALPAQESQDNAQFEIGNTRYLFDVSDNSPEELQSLLSRAEEIRETHADGYDELEIVLVLHGPDINIFRQQNYSKHKSLVDLAARLDAFDIIDMRICETTMTRMGVERSEVPSFIESVPYAPTEIRRLIDEGYINL